VETLNERNSEFETHGEGRNPAQPVVRVNEVVAAVNPSSKGGESFAEFVGVLG
jgi:hypothetical protein